MRNRKMEQIYKIGLNKDCRLKFVYMNQEYRVIVYQYGTVNCSIKEILTVYHILVMLEDGTWNILFKDIENGTEVKLQQGSRKGTCG